MPACQLKNKHWVVFRYLPEHTAPAGPGTRELSGMTPVETPVKTPDRIVELLRANPHMTLTQVAGEIGRSPRAVERAAAKLVSEGRLRYIGPRKGGHWETSE